MPAGLVIAALVAGANPHSLPVGNLFREACIDGELRLTRSRGEQIKWRDLPASVGTFKLINQNEKLAKYFKIHEAPETYLSMVQYDKSHPGNIISECVVISGAIDRKEAARIFTEGTPDKRVRASTSGAGGMWHIDVPEYHYRKTLLDEGDHMILMTTVFESPAR
ncbi:MAG TPA: hypothetical protein VGW34_15545 [Allosphingosinicella sp.]|nr:hypothetical protein [Allosphingosinicella sp.]